MCIIYIVYISIWVIKSVNIKCCNRNCIYYTPQTKITGRKRKNSHHGLGMCKHISFNIRIYIFIDYTRYRVRKDMGVIRRLFTRSASHDDYVKTISFCNKIYHYCYYNYSAVIFCHCPGLVIAKDPPPQTSHMFFVLTTHIIYNKTIIYTNSNTYIQIYIIIHTYRMAQDSILISKTRRQRRRFRQKKFFYLSCQRQCIPMQFIAGAAATAATIGITVILQ